MSVDVAVWAGTVFAGLGLLGAGGAWLFRTAIKPLKIVVENNTAAWTMVVATLTKQDETLGDHEVRLNTIETTHDILKCTERKRL